MTRCEEKKPELAPATRTRQREEREQEKPIEAAAHRHSLIGAERQDGRLQNERRILEILHPPTGIGQGDVHALTHAIDRLENGIEVNKRIGFDRRAQSIHQRQINFERLVNIEEPQDEIDEERDGWCSVADEQSPTRARPARRRSLRLPQVSGRLHDLFVECSRREAGHFGESLIQPTVSDINIRRPRRKCRSADFEIGSS